MLVMNEVDKTLDYDRGSHHEFKEVIKMLKFGIWFKCSKNLDSASYVIAMNKAQYSQFWKSNQKMTSYKH